MACNSMTDNRCRSPTRLACPSGWATRGARWPQSPHSQPLRISSAPIQISYSVMSCEPHEGHDLPAVQPADGRWSSSVQPTPGAQRHRGNALNGPSPPARCCSAWPGTCQPRSGSSQLYSCGAERLRVQAEVPPASDASHLPRQPHRRTATRQALLPGDCETPRPWPALQAPGLPAASRPGRARHS